MQREKDTIHNNQKGQKSSGRMLPAVLVIFFLLTVLGLVMLPGCPVPGENNAAPADGQLTILRNKLLVGTDPTYPPFEFMQDGEIVGFDIDIAREISLRLDRKMEVVPLDWDFSYRIPEDTDLDMIISAINAAEDRDQFVDFSEPYYILEYMLIVLSDARPSIKEDLKGKRMGMIDIKVKDLDPEYLKDFIIEEYQEVLVMMEDLRNRNIDGVLLSLPVGKNIIEENDGIYSVLEVVKSMNSFNIVFPEGSPLKEEVDSILEEMVQDGTYEQVYQEWFSLEQDS